MLPTLYYCYDAWCGWCYGFSPVIKKIAEIYAGKMHFEVLSGGMVLPETPLSIGATAGYILEAYPRVEEMTGVKFGDDYLWHLRNPDMSDWFPHSEKPAVALVIFRELYPEQQIAFIADLQYGLFTEGRDLTDDEAYRHLLHKYNIAPDVFYEKLHSEHYKEGAHYDFALCKQLQVTGFPTLLLQVSRTKFYLVARGYTPFERVQAVIEKILAEVNTP